MIVIVVQGGTVHAVYTDEPDEEIKVLDLDNAESGDAEVTADQMRREIAQVHREIHQVL